MKRVSALVCRVSSAGSAAFQHAVAYAKERIQGTPVWEMKNPAAKAVTIINHPDVRKKLMWMKSHVEGIRALAYFGAYCMDMSKISKTEEEKANWEGYLELLTPIIKSYSTDKGLLICSAGHGCLRWIRILFGIPRGAINAR